MLSALRLVHFKAISIFKVWLQKKDVHFLFHTDFLNYSSAIKNPFESVWHVNNPLSEVNFYVSFHWKNEKVKKFEDSS